MINLRAFICAAIFSLSVCTKHPFLGTKQSAAYSELICSFPFILVNNVAQLAIEQQRNAAAAIACCNRMVHEMGHKK